MHSAISIRFETTRSVPVNGILPSLKSFLTLFSVTQGSVMGSLVFTTYNGLHVIIVHRCGVKHYLYADDTQLYISLDPYIELKLSSSFKNLEHFIADIRLKYF